MFQLLKSITKEDDNWVGEGLLALKAKIEKKKKKKELDLYDHFQLILISFELLYFVLLAILSIRLFEIVNLLIWFFEGPTEHGRGDLVPSLNIKFGNILCFWASRKINLRFCSKTQWHMSLLVFGHHGVSIQISINRGKKKITAYLVYVKFAFFLFPDSGLYLVKRFWFLFWSILNSVTLKTGNWRSWQSLCRYMGITFKDVEKQYNSLDAFLSEHPFHNHMSFQGYACTPHER